MLQLTFPTYIHDFIFEARKTVSQATPRMMIVAAGILSVFALAITASVLYAHAPSCAAGESLLVYSRYDKKGIANGHAYRCGQPHPTCVARSGGEAYDCSPFMAPKNSLSWR